MQAAASKAVRQGCALPSHTHSDCRPDKPGRTLKAATHSVRRRPAKRTAVSASSEQNATFTDRQLAEARRRIREDSGAIDTTISPSKTEEDFDNDMDDEPDDESDDESDSDGDDEAVQTLRSRYGNLGGAPHSEFKRRAQALRKADLIREMAKAGPRLEQVIRDNQHEIDDELLALLQGRAELALQLKERGAKGLMMLWHHLKKFKERYEAPPAAALLNDCLDAMHPDRQLPLAIRRQETKRLIGQAFGFPMQTGPVDIFGIAASLGEDPSYEPEDTMRQTEAVVTQGAFLKEAQDLLREAIQNQRELEGARVSRSVSFKREELEAVVQERRTAITVLREIIELAKKPVY